MASELQVIVKQINSQKRSLTLTLSRETFLDRPFYRSVYFFSLRNQVVLWFLSALLDTSRLHSHLSTALMHTSFVIFRHQSIYC